MGATVLKIVIGAVAFTSIGVTWKTFDSTIYPYSISQPSSFRHFVLPMADGARADYFFPSLGSSTTDVNIRAERGADTSGDGVAFLKSIDGQHVHQAGWLTVMGHRRRLITGSFSGIVGQHQVEEISFSANGYMWRLTASYESKYKKLWPMMRRMLESFKLNETAHR